MSDTFGHDAPPVSVLAEAVAGQLSLLPGTTVPDLDESKRFVKVSGANGAPLSAR